MNKTETIHTRVTPEIKKQAETIFKSVGLTTSQAIELFLVASVNYNGLPFLVNKPIKNDIDINLATAIAKVDGVAPSNQAQEIMYSYLNNNIDYKAAKEAIKRIYKPV